MRFIAISFTLKGQDLADIGKVLEQLSLQTGGNTGNTMLINGPKHVVIEKGFSTDLVNLLSELFPFQVNCYVGAGPDRKNMANIIKQTKAEVFVIGEIKEGVAEEVNFYKEQNIVISEIPFKWTGDMIGRPLTFGQRAVGLTFNHGEGEIFQQVNGAKQTCADAIDQMYDLREKSTSGEYKALSTIAIRALQLAQMQMVKAITWKD